MFLDDPWLFSMHRERKKEILSDDRVRAAQAAGRGGRVRTAQESAAASSITVAGKDDSRTQASPAALQNGSQHSHKASSKLSPYPFFIMSRVSSAPQSRHNRKRAEECCGLQQGDYWQGSQPGLACCPAECDVQISQHALSLPQSQ